MFTTLLDRFVYAAGAGMAEILGFVSILNWIDRKSGKNAKLNRYEMAMIGALGAGMGVFYALLRTAEDLVHR